MIKLVKGDVPIYLSDEKVKSLVERYVATKSSISWPEKGLLYL